MDQQHSTSTPHMFLLGMGLIFLLINGWAFSRAYMLKHYGQPIQGTVSRCYIVRRKGGFSYNVDYAYAVSGASYDGTGDLTRNTFLALKPGDAIPLRYVSSNPAVSETQDSSHANTSLFLSTVFGFPVSFFVLFLAFKPDRAAPAQPARSSPTPRPPLVVVDPRPAAESPDKVQGIAFTMYPVIDMKRARRFYEEDLGLKAARDFRGEWVEYHLGGNCFAITTMASDGIKPSIDSGGSIAFEVEDVDALVNQLRAKGVRIKMEPFATPICRMAVIIDSEGNALTLHQRTRLPSYDA